MDKKLQKDFQQRPAWIFITVVILLIQASPVFSELFLDFFPCWIHYKKWISLSFIIFILFLLMGVYWLERQKYRAPDKMSENESLKKAEKKYKWMTWRQNIFKHYPLNIITLRIVPLFICWIISNFINKEYKSCLFDSFDFPRHWEKYSETSEDKEKYNYEKVTSKFFKSMIRVYIGGEINQSYEVKFERDFQHIELRWIDKNTEKKFSEPKNELYETVFSKDRFKHIEIFTWIFPFGLYWNLIRVIKNLFSKKKKFKKS